MMRTRKRMLPLLAVPLAVAAALTVSASGNAWADVTATFGNVSCSGGVYGQNVYGACTSPSAPNHHVTMHFGCNFDPNMHTANATPEATVTNGVTYWANDPSGYCWQGANQVYFTSP